jgi:rhomboid family GlyGly-CTERM serine protease
MTLSEPADEVPSGTYFHRLLRSLNCDGARAVALVLACLALLAAELGGDAARQALRYDRDALAAGEWWRLATAHLVHLSFEHAAVNALGLVLLWMLFVRDFTARGWLLILASSAAAIDLGLWVADSTVRWYVGSSGVLHGLLAAGIAAQLRRGRPEGWLLAVLLVGKLTYEQSVGALPLVPGPVVVDAHLYGALGGLLAALFCPLGPARAAPGRWRRRAEERRAAAAPGGPHEPV